MELDIRLNLNDDEVRSWIEYAVLRGWKRPRHWAKMERQAAVIYGIQCAIGCQSSSEEISAYIEQKLDALMGPAE